MKTYARIFRAEVVEIISPAVYPSDAPVGIEPTWKAGDEIPLSQRYTMEFCNTCVDITSTTPQPQEGWAYDEANFTAPTAG